MLDRRAIVVILAAGAVSGLAAWSLFPAREARVSQTPASRGADPLVVSGGALAKGTRTVTERASEPITLSGESTEGAVQRAGPHAEDKPEMRAALEVQAELAAPYWSRLSPRIADPKLRAVSAGMIERLRALNEPAELIARDEYALTQTLIAEGGWDNQTLATLQYLNSTSASVIQGGDPAEIPLP